MISHFTSYLWLALGFGFVIFWHELGHFLAAKWAGVKVEQFAVGFGHALLSWRKGLGTRVGTSKNEYDHKIRQHLIQAQNLNEGHEFSDLEMSRGADELGLGETEYRLNWIPLGGYVKMLGQDDLRPNAQQSDPRAYNMKSVGARMVIVSAGVIMNIILAAFGFMVLFLMGFNAPPAKVGSVVPNSPAQLAVTQDNRPAPLQVGDQILYLDGKYQHDFTKISLNTALLEEGKRTPMVVRRRGPEGKEETIYVTPARLGDDGRGFLMLGIEQPRELRGIDVKDAEQLDTKDIANLVPKDTLAIKPGDVITAINGQPVAHEKQANGTYPDEYWKLDQALQDSDGRPVELTVRNAGGQTRTVSVTPLFQQVFGRSPMNFAGMQPRSSIESVMENSSARGKLMPGDVIVKMSTAGDVHLNPSNRQFKEWLRAAGAQEGQKVTLQVLRDGQVVDVPPVEPNIKLAPGEKGLGVALGYDAAHAVVAEVLPDSPAAAAGIEPGSTLATINGEKIGNWFQVARLFGRALPDQPIQVTGTNPDGVDKTWTISLKQDQIAMIGRYRVTHALALHDRIEPRKTSNPLVAAGWGVVETRDFTLQFYLTLKRMFQGSVSYTNMMGPVGIVYHGAKLAYKGTDWLIWFLAMISANLAVVNFLPIPIVDGGLFTFLVIEKVQGRPLSPRAQSIAQVVGMALLLGIFLLVTYQDINRIF